MTSSRTRARLVVGREDLLPRSQVQADAESVVPVARLDDNRQAQFASRRPGIFAVSDGPAIGHRHADFAQQGLGQVLVQRNGLSDLAGPIGDGRQQAALRAPCPSWTRLTGSSRPHGDAPLSRRGHQRPGGRSQAHVVGQIAQPPQAARGVDDVAPHCCRAEFTGEFETGARQGGFFTFDGEQKHLGLARLTDAAKFHGAAAKRMQRPHNVQQCLGRPRRGPLATAANMRITRAAAANPPAAAVANRVGQPLPDA